jgi:hypothetical protein
MCGPSPSRRELPNDALHRAAARGARSGAGERNSRPHILPLPLTGKEQSTTAMQNMTRIIATFRPPRRLYRDGVRARRATGRAGGQGQACAEALPAIARYEVDRFGAVHASATGSEADVVERNFQDASLVGAAGRRGCPVSLRRCTSLSEWRTPNRARSWRALTALAFSSKPAPRCAACSLSRNGFSVDALHCIPAPGFADRARGRAAVPRAVTPR